ncbi:hypothetical protein PAPYR_11211 [Paratrimastix pyriformis]|uniref:Uncharacterized protein n=1 Tax=Paratrimastix pyriformis TaxID=342808 RepID=A0ABQ8UA01_9EUKA|nr:hypothetical protein PAPYR_11211 [Paratrimastix pyriformis]
MPDHCCSAAFCLTEITVTSQPPDSAFSGSLLRLEAIPHAEIGEQNCAKTRKILDRFSIFPGWCTKLCRVLNYVKYGRAP